MSLCIRFVSDAMVNDYEDDGLARLPLEVWVKVFSYLNGPDLFRCEAVCADWRQEILHQVQCGGCRCGVTRSRVVQVVTGRLTRRGLKCVRLQTEAGGCLEHRRGLWDSVSLMADRDVLITGVGVYSPSGQTQVCIIIKT